MSNYAILIIVVRRHTHRRTCVSELTTRDWSAGIMWATSISGFIFNQFDFTLIARLKPSS